MKTVFRHFIGINYSGAQTPTASRERRAASFASYVIDVGVMVVGGVLGMCVLAWRLSRF